MRPTVFLVGLMVAVSAEAASLGSAHTHAPKLKAPDSESVMNVEGHEQSMQAMHHSDMHLGGKIATKNQPALVADSNPPESEVHHSDAHLMGTSRRDDQEATTVPGEHTTKSPGDPISTVSHRYHAGSQDSGKDETKSSQKSIISHSPMKSLPEHIAKPGADAHPDSESVLTHVPMAKNLGHHDKSHGHGQQLPDKTNVQHAPIAGNHQPKPSHAHHPSLSKVDPAVPPGAPSAHSPMVHVHSDESDKHEKMAEVEEKPAAVSPVKHAPLATEHHAPKLAHHPSLSKGEVVPPGAAHAPLAIPSKHLENERIHIEKKSVAVKVEPSTSKPTDATQTAKDSVNIKPAAHHPFLSKTEPVAPLIKSPDVPSNDKPVKTGVSSTTEVSGNFLEPRQIIPGSHPLAILPHLTQSPPS